MTTDTPTFTFTELLAMSLEDHYICNDRDEAKELADKIVEDGIICDETEIEQLCEAYAGWDGGWHPERDFAEEYCCETGLVDENHPLYSFIDFGDVWERLLRFDMTDVHTENGSYFFHNY